MYKVVYLPTARKQLEDAVMYIAVDLCAPDAAMNLADEVDEAVQKLKEIPYRFPLYEKASAKHDKLEAEVARRKNKARQIAAFIDQLEKAPASLEEWDSQVWSLLLEKGTVNRDGSITFEFRNGKEIKVEAK